ncbi:hypothetical protein [Paenibacillus chitinolyticus]
MEKLKEGQPVKHVKRKLYEARFVAYTKSGRAKVRHNYAAPYGVQWVTDIFNAENIVPV